MEGKDAKWGAGSQQDSHEFLIALLAILQTECDRNTRKPRYRELKGEGSEATQARDAAEYARLWSNSIVDDVFGGLLQSTIRCQVRSAERLAWRFRVSCLFSMCIAHPLIRINGSSFELEL